MTRVQRFLLMMLMCLWCVPQAQAATQSINTLPEQDANFFSRLSTFLRDEISQRYNHQLGRFVVSGGLGATDAGLSHTVPTLTAYVHGYYVSQAGTAHTYTASRRTYVYADSQDADRDPEVTFSGGTGCTFQSRSTRLVFAECSSGSAAPTPNVVGLLALFYADTDADNITGVTDLRYRGPFQERTGAFHVKDFGATCDGTTDDTAAVQAAIDVAVLPSQLIVLCPGTMRVDGPVNVSKSVTLAGLGMAVTTLTSADVDNIMISVVSGVTHVTLRDFMLTRSVNAVAGGNGISALGAHNNLMFENLVVQNQYNGFDLGLCYYCRAAHITSQNNNLDGVHFTYSGAADGGTLQWQIYEVLSQRNLGVGFGGQNTAAANGIGPFLTDCWTFGNQFGGFVFIGESGTPINDLILISPRSSADLAVGLYFETFGHGHMLISPWAELAGTSGGDLGSTVSPTTVAAPGEGSGLVLGNNDPGFTVNGGYIWNNSDTGIRTATAGSAFLNMVVSGNGLGLSATPSLRSGIFIDANDVIVHGVSFQDPGGETSYIYYGGTPVNSLIGVNSYDAGLAQSAWVNSGDAASMAAGAVIPMGQTVFVGTGRPFGLKDISGGATPSKFFDVSSGSFRILNDAFTGALMTITDAGVPAFPGITNAPGSSFAACFDADEKLYRSTTGTCP